MPRADSNRILVRCDVGPRAGVGHLMRCVALAEEFLSRGTQVLFCADVEGVPWAAEQLARRGLPSVPGVATPAEHVALTRDTEAALVVIDSYLLSPDIYADVRAAGTPVLAVVDGEIGGRQADIYLDQNIDAEKLEPHLPFGGVRLAGLEFALMRDEILLGRPDRPSRVRDRQLTDVFAFFGGTDAFGAGPTIARVLAETGERFSATVVAGNPQRAQEISAEPLSEGQSINVIAPTSRLVDYVARADLVLSAAGSSIWELMCLGAATGLVCVADNQYDGYQRMIGTGATVGLGLLTAIEGDRSSAAAVVRQLLTETAQRDQLHAMAWQLVDGQGRRKVADVALRLVGIERES